MNPLLRHLDFNLLRLLDALLRAGSVEGAAERLDLTPSAVSHGLGRLRRALNDPLWVRRGRHLAPTPRALALQEPVQAAMAAFASVFAEPEAFDPARLERVFTLVLTDHTALALLPRLRQRLSQAAPGVRLRVLPLGPDAYQPLLAGEADLGVAGFRVPPAGIALRPLGAEPYVCLVRAGHPLATSGWGLEAYLQSEHLLISPIALTLGHVDQALAALGHSRRLGCTVPHFLLTPHLLASGDLVATLFASVAEAFAHPAHGLVQGPAPFPIPPFPIALAHPEWLAKDPAQRWLQAQVVAAWGTADSIEFGSSDSLEA